MVHLDEALVAALVGVGAGAQRRVLLAGFAKGAPDPALAALYPFAKRFIHIPQAILGIAFGWGTIMAWTATRNTVEPQAWIVFAATAVWAIAYDTIYAVQDQEDDRRIGVKSSALLFGSALWMAVGLALGTMLVLLVLAGRLADIGWAYYLTLGAVGLFFAVQSAALRNRID